MILLALIVAAIASAQKLEIQFATQPVVEERLRTYAHKNAEREPALRKLFENAGCKGDSLVEQKVRSDRPNLVCSLPGSSQSIIVVGAHYDLVEKGDGVVDNWSGASLLPSLYEGLAAKPRQHTFVFVGFMGEEEGLVGSQAFVKQLGKNPEQRVRAMVNMDTLGLGETEVWVSHADKEMVEWLGGVAAALKLPVSGVNVDQVGTTDSESFRNKKIPAITIHSLTNETLSLLHSPKDRIEAMHMDEYYRTYQLIAGYLAFLDLKLSTVQGVDH